MKDSVVHRVAGCRSTRFFALFILFAISDVISACGSGDKAINRATVTVADVRIPDVRIPDGGGPGSPAPDASAVVDTSEQPSDAAVKDKGLAKDDGTLAQDGTIFGTDADVQDAPGSSDISVEADAGAVVDTTPVDLGCKPRPEICDGRDNDCNGRIDETFDFEADPDHCNGCGRRCSRVHAEATCENGSCQLICEPGYADCDKNKANGCEASLAHAENCGSCAKVCDAEARCRPDTAGIYHCLPRIPPPCGVCTPGGIEDKPCGVQCGRKKRSCTSDCSWSEWSKCEGEGVCTRDALTQKGCENACQRRRCTSACTYGSAPDTCTECACQRIAQVCGVSCPQDYHLTRRFRSTLCGGRGFQDNTIACAPNCGTVFKQCGFNCPRGYHRIRWHYTNDCGGSPLIENTAVCQKNAKEFRACGNRCPEGYLRRGRLRDASCEGAPLLGNNAVNCLIDRS